MSFFDLPLFFFLERTHPIEGADDGTSVGADDGVRVGADVGADDGITVGADVGMADGVRVGADVGMAEGAGVGGSEGDGDGTNDRAMVGIVVGRLVGTTVGTTVGNHVGWTDGPYEGWMDGRGVGASVSATGAAHPQGSATNTGNTEHKSGSRNPSSPPDSKKAHRTGVLVPCNVTMPSGMVTNKPNPQM